MSKPNPLDTYYIREATKEDLPEILEIFNERIRNSTSLFIYDPVPLEDREAWFNDAKKNGYPVIVAVEKSTNKAIAYASYGAFRAKIAYILTTEISLYIHLDHHRRGLGRVMLNEMIRIAKEMGLRSVIASITSENSASVSLFTNFDFKLVGTFHDVGQKFGRHLDVDFYERIFDTPPTAHGVPHFNSFPWGHYVYGGSK
ncbi:acyl-CoA N-acyltransferase [Phycomyces blakesleeanus]|uniref:N-acetyltransferase domain-containing protein n=2 Tax=Phycomyces blakesleeanus TaxID=4837 RepID=A0A162TE21_PHYB8|nr:hypothetical protein PHYBLDRAFT_150933 [Phycomyces blakesleeanus NRRL 1555(-)]OAD67852.1 hypothetical protein PHYBLDRAFT_150933 [Phycomyces blakesleeanus NRRL 1555(-)]|eukprot:XP_018285892.1 hypothetical protein PHYBLDRAFT_150933 [Phycomyces blakesleeanus NRRL 1555(-)]